MKEAFACSMSISAVPFPLQHPIPAALMSQPCMTKKRLSLGQRYSPVSEKLEEGSRAETSSPEPQRSKKATPWQPRTKNTSNEYQASQSYPNKNYYENCKEAEHILSSPGDSGFDSLCRKEQLLLHISSLVTGSGNRKW